MQKDKKVLTIQDISCVGQCSLTVALPVISACGIETCVLPSAVLSTHTSGFSGFTFRDLTDDMPDIKKHWEKENIKFDAIYTGYLGSIKQIGYVKDIMETMLCDDGVRIVDPAMADNGKLYPPFDDAYAVEMATLCSVADIIIPNITEAAVITKSEIKLTGYSEEYICDLLKKLGELGAKNVILTGVSYNEKKLGAAIYERKSGNIEYYFHDRSEKNSHGTGDVYASTFTGAYMRGASIFDAAVLACDYTYRSILETVTDESHWYGVKFEKAIGYLLSELEKRKI